MRPVAALLLLALAAGAPAANAQPAPTPAPNQAALVIQHGDGRLVTACVAFDEPSISGLELLERSGVPFVAQRSSIGAAVCQIDGEGCAYPGEDCFCKRDGATSVYWAYNRLQAGEWALSPVGALSTSVRPGDVEGWAWGTGNPATGAVPPSITFAEVCQQAATVGPVASTAATAGPGATPAPAPEAPPTASSTGMYALAGALAAGLLVALLLIRRRR